MKKRLSASMVSLLLIFLFAFGAEAKLKVVTTTADFASIAREIGGDRIEVSSLVKGAQDPHFVDAKPSFIRLLNQADVLIEGGAELEIGWLPPLVENARNGKIQSGGPGRIVASMGVALLQIPTRPVDRSEGDVHPLGNPHYMLDPENGKVVGEEIAAALCRLDPGSCDRYRENQRVFHQRLGQKIAEWTKQMAPFRGAKIITYHDSWPYFAERFGLNVVGHIEPKPGIPPSTAHLKNLIGIVQQEEVRVILMEPFYNDQAPRLVAEKTEAKVAVLPPSVAPEMGIHDYLQLFDRLVAALTEALR